MEQTDRKDLNGGWRDELEGLLSAETLRKRDCPMRTLTTLRIGGPADFYLEPTSREELQRVLTFCRERKIPAFLMGRGSNLLVRDGGIRGLVYSLKHSFFSQIEPEGRLAVRAGAGAAMWAVSQFAQTSGISGFEFLEGIPGTLGGGLRMNAGAYKSCLFDILETVEVMDESGAVQKVDAEEIPHAYRSCPFFDSRVILSAVMRGYAGVPEQIRETMNQMREKRLGSQAQAPSAGCIFKNPPGHSAGQLIDELGFKGMSLGGAQVSERHANFLINKNKATAEDLMGLIQLIRERVRAAHGLELETEVMIIGEDIPNGKK